MRVAILLAIVALVAAIDPIIIKGNKFFNSVSGNQFYVIGVDYAPSTSTPDPLADTTSLNRDIPYFKQLGINTIRVYSTDSTANHTAGLQLLANAGIYLILDVTDSSFSINSGAPNWDLQLFNQVKAKLTPFLGQPGVLGFLAGNEVVNNWNQTNAAAYVKASIRDVKAYIKSQGYSTPVGYAATDVPANVPLQEYLDCISRDTSVDFYGLNTYRWCGNVTYSQTSYPELAQQFGNYHAPFIFTEYGCNTVNGTIIERPFTEVQAIYGSQMTGFLSGGLVYEWSQETNQYGLVTISGSTVTPRNDFNNLKNQIAQISPTIATLSGTSDTTSTVDSCPSQNQNGNTFLTYTASNTLPPTPNATICSCMFNQLNCITSVTDINNAASITADIQANTGFICGVIDCSAINANSGTGVYGQYSGCNALQRASYVLNAYYNQNKNQGRSACDQGNFKSVQFVASPSNQCDLGAAVTTTPAATAPVATTAAATSAAGTSSTVTTSTVTTSANPASTTATGSTTVRLGTGDARAIVPTILSVIIVCIMAL